MTEDRNYASVKVGDIVELLETNDDDLREWAEENNYPDMKITSVCNESELIWCENIPYAISMADVMLKTSNHTTTITKDKMNINDYKDAIPVSVMSQMELLDTKANCYQYWGYKYSENNESYSNSVVAFLLKHKEIENPFWVVLFNGAQYKKNDAIFVQAFKSLPDLSNAIYKQEGIGEDDVQKEDYKIIKNVVTAFDYLWFTDDETNNIEPLIFNDSYALEDLANQIIKDTHLSFNIKIPHQEVTSQTIENIKKLLEEANQILHSQKSA